MSVLDVVEGIVVVVEEVPTRDVAGETVVVMVDAVGEGEDQILRRQEARWPVAQGASRAPPRTTAATRESQA